MRIEKGLATLTQNQESLERIIETKFYDLDLKVTEIQTTVEQLQEEAEDGRGRATTEAFQRVPRAHRSAAVPVSDTRATTSAPAATTSVAPPVATPPVPQTSLKSLRMLSSPRHLPTLELLKIKPESRLALCIFKLFGNLLPKGEKNV